MPRGDGNGPPEAAAGRGGRKQGNRAGSGPGGNCICPKCGDKVPHIQGEPCYKKVCPRCGEAMIRGRI